ncbi:MAG: hypothetical protein WC890_02120 [Candidatus Margulisiibacteriota bacterium]
MKNWFKFAAILVIGACLFSTSSWAVFKAMPSENEIIGIIKSTMGQNVEGFNLVLGDKMAGRVPTNHDIYFTAKDIAYSDFKWDETGGGFSVPVKFRVPVVLAKGECMKGYEIARRYYDPNAYYQYNIDYSRGLFFAKSGKSYVITKGVNASKVSVVNGPNKIRSVGQTWAEKYSAGQ